MAAAKDPASPLSRLGRRGAIIVIGILAASACLLLVVAISYREPVAIPSVAKNDLPLYRHIVDAMRMGANYYDAAHQQLLAGGYGTLSVFNWRLPALPWVASLFSSLASLTLLIELIAFSGVVLAFIWLDKTTDRPTAFLAVVALVISLINCLDPELSVFADAVAGVLILLSACSYGVGLPYLGVATALAALFVRELAAPYVVVCVFVAWQTSKRRELLLWAVGLAAFVLYFAFHCASIWQRLGPADHSDGRHWLRLGGVTFDLTTAAFNGLLALAPLWVTALIVPFAILGLVAWTAPETKRVRLTVFAYFILFLFVGKQGDFYWGALYTPLMMLGLAFAPHGLIDLAAALRGSPAGGSVSGGSTKPSLS